MSTGPFGGRGEHDLRRLLAHAPVGWLVGLASAQALLMPMDPVWADDGGLLALDGHVARHHPLRVALQDDPRVLVLFLGVNGYMSPSWLSDRTQAPTWNSASLQVLAQIEWQPDPHWLATHLERLVARHEAGRAQPWSVADMGPRYTQLADRLVGFRARVIQARPRFKLGQDERADVFAEQCAALSGPGDLVLREWMIDHNSHRGGGRVGAA